MPKAKDSGFKDISNDERKETRDNAKYRDLEKEKKESGDYYYEDNFFNKDVDEWKNKMTKDELEGVRTYTGSTYREMNAYLREDKYGTGANPYIENIIREAENGINKFTLKQNLYLYRQSTADLLYQLEKVREIGISDKSEFVKMINRYKGSFITDRGFTSSSTRSDTWHGEVNYEIRTPKGTNCAYVNHISKNYGEYEVLFNRGTSFKIVGAKLKGNHPVVILQVAKK